MFKTLLLVSILAIYIRVTQKNVQFIILMKTILKHCSYHLDFTNRLKLKYHLIIM